MNCKYYPYKSGEIPEVGDLIFFNDRHALVVKVYMWDFDIVWLHNNKVILERPENFILIKRNGKAWLQWL